MNNSPAHKKAVSGCYHDYRCGTPGAGEVACQKVFNGGKKEIYELATSSRSTHIFIFFHKIILHSNLNLLFHLLLLWVNNIA